MARLAAAALLGAGAAGVLARGLQGTAGGRAAAGGAAALVGAVAVGAARGRPWALGVGFFLGLFVVWAAAGLGLQHRLSAQGAGAGIAWGLAVMASCVAARS